MLIVDTGPILAAADTSDPDHAICLDLLEGDAGPLVTTAMVVAEAAYLINRQLGPQAEVALYDSIVEGTLNVEPLGTNDWARIRELVDAYADFPLGGTDAGLVAIAERLAESPDRDSRPPPLRSDPPGSHRVVHAASVTPSGADVCKMYAES